MLEYSLSTSMDKILSERYGGELLLTVLPSEINPNRDLILFIGWEWLESKTRRGATREHPYIFASLVIPAIEIARERDRRLTTTGGRIEGGKVLVPSKKRPGTFVPDPGNYGKLWRIVHRTRRDAEDLTEHIRRFKEFLDTVDEHARRRRTNA